MADSRADQTPNTGGSGLTGAIRFMSTKRSETFLLSIRVVTLLFTFCYLIPFTPFSTSNLYKKTLLANAAISALRLHYRLPPFRFSREYFALLFIEDSAHYLFYSLIFITNSPITLVLLPITLFSLLNALNFILKILNATGARGTPQTLITAFLEQYQRRIFLTIALTEITLMPTIIFALMANLVTIFTPFMYSQFLSMRYSSQRNPYNRQAFHWLRISVENFANSPRCPAFFRNVLLKSIELVCRLDIQTVRQQ